MSDARPRIRPVAPGDREAWLRLRVALWPDEIGAHGAEIDAFFAGRPPRPWTVLVIEDDRGRLVGFAEASVRVHAEGCTTEDVGYLEGWFVEADCRRRGLGQALVAAAEDWARARGCREFASDADVDNEASARAHAGCGFDEVGVFRLFRKKL